VSQLRYRVPAIFLDRDGTIIEDRGDLGAPDQVVFLPGVIDALVALRADYALFIVTNQSAVARGCVTMAQVDAVNRRVVDTLASAGITIVRVFVCPHARTDGCDCIKPKPFFLRVAEREHHIDLPRSFAVGDHPHDVEFARSVGATGIYVLTGHGAKHREALGDDSVVLDSLAAVTSGLLCGLMDGRPAAG
jgi:D-glycero-D-manno-heptose 1,7-bisphosphate phosphatase